MDSGARKPYWNGTAVVVPSMSATLCDILNVIPRDYEFDADVVFRGRVVASVYLPEA